MPRPAYAYIAISVVKTNSMKKLIALYRHFSDKRYSTIAGTLVYFLLMSIAPTLLWMALIVGRIDIGNFVSGTMFDAIEPFISYLNKAAQEAASGAGIVLLVTSLYSSANFFYHLRRSGEIIYDCERKRGGFRLRVASVASVLITIIIVAVGVAFLIVGRNFIHSVLPDRAAECIRLIVTVCIALFAAMMLNLFACPVKTDLCGVLSGSLLTVLLWLVFASGFTLYTKYADPSKLYGAAAAIIVFLLWCYLMINSLVVGMIYNSLFIVKRRVFPLY